MPFTPTTPEKGQVMPSYQMYFGQDPHEGAFTKGTSIFAAGLIFGAALAFLGTHETSPPNAPRHAIEIAPPGPPGTHPREGERAPPPLQPDAANPRPASTGTSAAPNTGRPE